MDGNTHAINQHLYAMDTVDYAQEVLDQMTDKEVLDYAKDLDIQIKDDNGKWLNDGLEELYEKIEDNIDDFMYVFE